MDESKLLGLLTMRILVNNLSSFKFTLKDEIKEIIQTEFKVVRASDPISVLSKSFSRHQYIVVNNQDGTYSIAESKYVMDLFLGLN